MRTTFHCRHAVEGSRAFGRNGRPRLAVGDLRATSYPESIFPPRGRTPAGRRDASISRGANDHG